MQLSLTSENIRKPESENGFLMFSEGREKVH